MRKWLAVLCLVASPIWAACTGSSPTWTSTPDQASVQTCVTNSVDGDTINISAGTSNWAGASITTAKGINIIGAGGASTALAAVDATVIQSGSFSFTTPDGKAVRLSAISFSGTYGIHFQGASKLIRLDHIHTMTGSIGATSNRLIWFAPPTGTQKGVVDHCLFDTPNQSGGTVTTIFFFRDTDSDGGNGSWIRASGLGGDDAIYIEDCYFNFTSWNSSAAATDCESGGRFVVRHNTIKGTYVQWHDAIVTNRRGCRKVEIYSNAFQRVDGTQVFYVDARGAAFVMYDNTYSVPLDFSEMVMILYRANGVSGGNPWNPLCGNSSGKACLGSASTYSRTCTVDADCGGFVGSCIAIDATAGSPSGYPCRDQTGWTGNTTRTSEPALFWNNKTLAGVDGRFSFTPSSYIQSGIDYCNASTTKPTTCNGITTTYTAYTYPYPTIGGAPSTGPSNFRYVPIDYVQPYYEMMMETAWH